MNIRPIQEGDIEAVIQLFRANYGDDYAMPEFYDPMWVKRGIYSDHILWLVIEEGGRIVASGACILNFGDYNDQIGEIGRLVVDPSLGGKGLGRALLAALVEASNDRVEFAFAEARTVHSKTQKIDDHIGLAPLGFLPMYYRLRWRESLILSGQLFGNGRSLRQPGTAQVIPPVAPLARLSLRNLGLDEPLAVREGTRGYPIDSSLTISPLTGNALLRLLKIEYGRVVEPEVFGSMHIDQGLPQLLSQRATYFVATEGDRTLGAVGLIHDEHHQSVRIIELIAQENTVKGSLLRFAVEHAEQQHQAEIVKCDICANCPQIQQTLYEMGFLPAAYVPGMVFHNTSRWDVVKMVKLNVPWELGPLELTEPSREYFDLVAPAFERAAADRRSNLPSLRSPALRCFTALEAYLFQRAGNPARLEAGTPLAPESMHLVLEGSVQQDGRVIGPGGCINPGLVFGMHEGYDAVAGTGTRVLTLTERHLQELADRYPRLGIKLYQNLAAYRAGMHR